MPSRKEDGCAAWERLACLISCVIVVLLLGGCGEDSSVVIPAAQDTARVSFQDGLSPTTSYAGTKDAIIKDGTSNDMRNGNFGAASSDTLGSARLSTGFFERRLVVAFDLSSITNCSQVLSATLTIRISSAASGTMTLEAHRIVRPGWSAWVEGGGGVAQGVSWTTVDGSAPWTVEGGDFDDAVLDARRVSPGDTAVSFALPSALVKSWILDDGSNHGVIIKGTDVSRELFAEVSMRESLSSASRPRLDITYLKGP